MDIRRVSALLVCLLASPVLGTAQNQTQNHTPAQDYYASHAIPSGTRFLAVLKNKLSTSDVKSGDIFEAVTLEPLTAIDGTVVRPGTEIRGHVDKVEQTHKTGRGRLWLTFDDIRLPGGWAPLVAVVDDVPGVHSIHVDSQRDGEIEAQADKRKDAEAAAAAGAFVGAATGVASRNAKDAATGAAIGAVTAFMAVSGLGQEVTLDPTTKLELLLERDLTLTSD
jgi:hypothetical protein